MSWLDTHYYAHRGLHDIGAGVPENSLAAVAAARAGGYGVEVDVQLSADGIPMVFHDATLARETGAPGAIANRPVDDLTALKLRGTDEPVPTLKAALETAGRDTPILLELKAPHPWVGPLCRAVKTALRSHRGPAAVMSFNPLVQWWFRLHAPDVARGMLDQPRWPPLATSDMSLVRWMQLTTLKTIDLEDGDYLAYHETLLTPRQIARLKRGHKKRLLAWTVRDAHRARALLANGIDAVIFEGFRP